MLYLDVLRGEDSTGVAAISRPFEDNTKIEVFKSVGSATDFFYDHAKYKRSRDFTTEPVGVMIGHNRFATQGKVNEENAHPFEFDNVVGAHNGTVNQYSLKNFHGYKDFDVDSQIIYSHLSHTRSIDQVWEEADGALALVWWDKVDNKLNLIRNNQRTLHLAYSDDDKLVMWSSEVWMLLVAAMRHGIKLKEAIDLKPNRLYTFSNAADGKMFHTERDLPPFVAKPVVSYYGNYGSNYGRGWDRDWDDDWWDDKKDKAEDLDKDENIVVIREIHDTKYIPSALAFTKDGRTVRVNIPVNKGKEAIDKIRGRGMTKGYYIAKKIYKSSVNKEDLWCNWADLAYIQLKGDGHILRKENNGFEVRYAVGGGEYAPWFEPNQFLVQGAWNSRTACGCVNCLRVPNWGQRNELKWIDRGTFFCPDCQELSLVKDLIQEYEESKQKSA